MSKRAVAQSGGDVLDYYEIAPEQPFSTDCGVRYLPLYTGATGYREIVHVGTGFELVLSDVFHDQQIEISHAEPASLKFHFRLEGSGRIGFPGTADALVEEHTFGVLLHPEGALKTETFLAGQHEQSVTLLCTASFLQEQMQAGEFPTPIDGFVLGQTPDYYHIALPMRVEMMAAVRSLLGLETTGELRRIYCQAKALELLSLSLLCLVDHGEHKTETGRGFSPRDLECLNAARTLLERDYVHPPNIGTLASTVGINEAKLMRGFKQLFGQTVFEYAQHLRMEQAKKLLENSDQSITDIAFEVGYEYSSNFATAFRRHFGISPRAARQASKS